MEIVKVNPFTNVVATGKATTQWIPPRACSLFGFVFAMGGTFTIGTHITGITIKAPGGKRLIPGISGARFQDMYEYEGLINDTGYFLVPFGDPTARTFSGKHLGNFDHTVYPGPMTIEVDIAGATNPTLEAYALVMPPKALLGAGYSPGDIQSHRALIESTLQFSAAVTSQAKDISLGTAAGALVKKLFFFSASLAITRLAIKKAGFDIYDDVPNALANWLQDDILLKLPQANLLVADFIADGDYSDVLTTIQSNGLPFNYQVLFTTSGADTVTAYADTLTKLALI